MAVIEQDAYNVLMPLVVVKDRIPMLDIVLPSVLVAPLRSLGSYLLNLGVR